jgi:uncharacterized Ntn-hydrolase superfamily protein
MGQQILDSMQTRFLTTQGTLADRLMAALQGAKVIGADTRCAAHHTSSQSSFLRVAKMTDPYDSLYLGLWMAYPQNYSGIFPVDPIDSLQTLYNLWKGSTTINDKGTVSPDFVKVYNGERGITVFDFTLCKGYRNLQITIFDILGRSLLKQPVSSRILRINTSELVSNGILIYQVSRQDQFVVAKGKFFNK